MNQVRKEDDNVSGIKKDNSESRKKEKKKDNSEQGRKEYDNKSGMKGRRQCFINLCKQRKTTMFQVKRKTTMF